MILYKVSKAKGEKTSNRSSLAPQSWIREVPPPKKKRYFKSLAHPELAAKQGINEPAQLYELYTTVA